MSFVIAERCGWRGTSRALCMGLCLCLQGWRSRCLSGLLFQCLTTVMMKAFFLCTTSDVSVFQLVSVAPCLSAVFWCLFVRASVGEHVCLD